MTILKITDAQNLIEMGNSMVDVSWASPFSSERELLITAKGTALLEPNLEDCFETLDEKCFIKKVNFCVDTTEKYLGHYFSSLKKNVANFENSLYTVSFRKVCLNV